MTTSPERGLGGSLMEEIDKELSPREVDFESKDETSCKTASEKKLSLIQSTLSLPVHHFLKIINFQHIINSHLSL